MNLHVALLPRQHYAVPLERMWARKREIEIHGRTAHVLSPTDALLALLGHGFCRGSRRSLAWAVDARLALDFQAQIDWADLVSLAKTTQLTLPVLVTLGYLVRALDAVVPDDTLAALDEGSAPTPLARDVAISCAWHAARRAALTPRAIGVRGGIALTRWAIAPSAEYLRATGSDGVAVAYARRALQWHRRAEDETATTLGWVGLSAP